MTQKRRPVKVISTRGTISQIDTEHRILYIDGLTCLRVVKLIQEKEILRLYLIEFGFPIGCFNEQFLLPVNSLSPQLVEFKHLLVQESVLK